MPETTDKSIVVRQAMRSVEEAKEAFPILRYFAYAHLPAELKLISAPFADVAWLMAESLPANAELSAGLRKLLEAKDCFVRAALP